MKKECKSLVLSEIALFISVVAILVAYFRCEPMTADWMGVLVGILSLLVTALAIFFAFSYLTFERRMKQMTDSKIEEALMDFDTVASKAILAAKFSLLDLFRKDFLKRRDMGFYSVVLILSLEIVVQMKDKETTDLILDCLIDVYSEYKVAMVLNIDKRYIDKLFSQLNELSGRKVHILQGHLDIVYNRSCNNTASL